jgi:hypothetical protein
MPNLKRPKSQEKKPLPDSRSSHQPEILSLTAKFHALLSLERPPFVTSLAVCKAIVDTERPFIIVTVAATRPSRGSKVHRDQRCRNLTPTRAAPQDSVAGRTARTAMFGVIEIHVISP